MHSRDYCLSLLLGFSLPLVSNMFPSLFSVVEVYMYNYVVRVLIEPSSKSKAHHVQLISSSNIMLPVGLY